RVGSSNDYDVHYIKFAPSASNQWQEYKRVSDIDPPYLYGAENQDLAIFSERVFVNYVTSELQPINRDRNIDLSWNTPEVIPFNMLPMVNQVHRVRPLIIGNELNIIYANSWGGMNNYSGVLIGHSYKNINSNSWTQVTGYLETEHLDPYTVYPFVANSTNDGKIHLIYWDKNQINYSYRTIINHSFSNHIATIPIANRLSNTLLANGNDLYLITTGNTSTPGNILFRHYDAAPLAPADYSVSIHQSGSNYYPKLTWQLNNEPDVRLKTSNAYKIERRTRPLNGSWSAWSTIANLSGTTSSYIDYTIGNAGGGDREAEYRLTAIDIGNNSSPTQSVIIDYGFNRAEKTAVTGIVRDYSLEQNYPNPFNPNTNISYSIKEEGLVTLKVYDVLGKEIAVLVNENKPAGIYEVSFNASNLPSGMYIYKLQSGSFTDVKKMLLTK
ncbi:MAG: T9SS type A sorting domain-containing protein, partial [Candidatus Eremiobacterota bacterium]